MDDHDYLPPKLKNKIIPLIVVKGYFVKYDQWNRAKLMFLDDYDGDLPKMSFAKSYMLMKANSTDGKSPLVDNNKYMLINCPKNALGYLPDTSENATKIKVVPINKLIQHKVRCVVAVKNYKFKKGNQTIQGWNLKLSEMTMLEL